MDDKTIRQILEYRESLYEQLTAINGMLGDEMYTRRSVSSFYEEKYGVKRMFYITSIAKPMVFSPVATFVAEREP